MLFDGLRGCLVTGLQGGGLYFLAFVDQTLPEAMTTREAHKASRISKVMMTG